MKTYSYYKEQTEGLIGVLDTVKSSEKVAASNIHFLKLAVSRLKIYTDTVEVMLGRLSSNEEYENHPLLKRSRGGRSLIVISGEKGLVGGLWHRIVEQAIRHAPDYRDITIIGAKGAEYLKEERVPAHKTYVLERQIPTKTDADYITNPFFMRFMHGNISAVDVLYPAFSSLVDQEPKLVPFLPFTFLDKTAEVTREDPKATVCFPIFEPSKKRIFTELLKKHISTYFYRILLESKLSEFSARTVEMEHAAEQTKILIKKSRIAYSKERRAAVTGRQLENFSSHMKV